ncbi:MAG: hypothetical protein ACR2PL_18970 [Dehalococcoidia bacterium]
MSIVTINTSDAASWAKSFPSIDEALQFAWSRASSLCRFYGSSYSASVETVSVGTERVWLVRTQRGSRLASVTLTPVA